MSLWVDRYRPKSLSQLTYHDSITQNLAALSKSGDFPHLLVYGPSGAGKKTRIYSTLNEIFGAQVEKLKIDVKTFTTSSNRKLEFNVLSSNHHLEITPSDMGNNDRVVIQDLLKDVASTEQVDFQNSQKKHRFKIVIINEADSLSRDAQAALRRTMEKYSTNIRLVLVCNTISNIIAPIKSRTLLVRIPSPSVHDISQVLLKVSKKEGLKYSTNNEDEIVRFLDNVAQHANRNLRRALLSFETLAMQQETIQTGNNLDILNLDWEIIIKNMSRQIKTNRNVATLAKVRVIFYELLAHCIPARTILKTLLFELLGLFDDTSIIEGLVELASVFDERLSLGLKSIFHLEGFVAKAMVVMEHGS
ncbi:DNA replication factor C [Suhomyces tanzawaensis NRRL Y-17324]|uniref:DNA replication factor C n=1 Tax=Suhomyces tanzawaensis NRRL Y-17324 TaxID=984487 RepID=A0A1E4SLN8_9ASCO|nr:DNA replication factor C [Suhomyces tanzawaensis NRRL Y-17324]ODV80441.1 DNA replication factor C [Suhomyces tanzawaensis NRRL Y-17324]